MPTYRVVERIFRERFVEADGEAAIRNLFDDSPPDGGEDYDWEVVTIELQSEEEDA